MASYGFLRLTKHMFIFFVVEWRLQQSNVCFSSRGNKFGSFTMKNSGRLTAIKLVHKSGYVGCAPSGKSNWGCGSAGISIGITDDKNKVIFPDNLASNGWANIPSYTSKSKEIIFKTPAVSTYAAEGKNMRLWYGEDLRDSTESDNIGRACADVYVQLIGMFT